MIRLKNSYSLWFYKVRWRYKKHHYSNKYKWKHLNFNSKHFYTRNFVAKIHWEAFPIKSRKKSGKVLEKVFLHSNYQKLFYFPITLLSSQLLSIIKKRTAKKSFHKKSSESSCRDSVVSQTQKSLVHCIIRILIAKMRRGEKKREWNKT